MAHKYSDVSLSSNTCIYDIDAIKQSIYTILHTQQGERINNPLFGLNLENYLYTSMDGHQSMKIRSAIIDTLKLDTRYTIEKCDITPDYDNNEYLINIQMSLNDIFFEINDTIKNKVV